MSVHFQLGLRKGRSFAGMPTPQKTHMVSSWQGQNPEFPHLVAVIVVYYVYSLVYLEKPNGKKKRLGGSAAPPVDLRHFLLC